MKLGLGLGLTRITRRVRRETAEILNGFLLQNGDFLSLENGDILELN